MINYYICIFVKGISNGVFSVLRYISTLLALSIGSIDCRTQKHALLW